MKYLLFIIPFIMSCSANFNSSDVKDALDSCFSSGGEEFSWDYSLGPRCTYKSNSCSMEHK